MESFLLLFIIFRTTFDPPKRGAHGDHAGEGSWVVPLPGETVYIRSPRRPHGSKLFPNVATLGAHERLMGGSLGYCPEHAASLQILSQCCKH